jgi:hypothetical protein
MHGSATKNTSDEIEERTQMMGKVELSFKLSHPPEAGLCVALSLRLSAVRISTSVCPIMSLVKPESHTTAVECHEILDSYARKFHKKVGERAGEPCTRWMGLRFSPSHLHVSKA